MFGAGAVTGYFAVAYTIIVFPIALIFLPRLWSIARVHHYVTPADFIRGRSGRGAWRWPSPSPASSR
jgi:Na+/proline symporter